jgi:HEAT repeat protein
MKTGRIINLEPRERILEKAKKYVESVETFLEDGDDATRLLLQAMKLADRPLKREIMLVLGSFAKDKILWPLYELMTNASEDEEVRHDASIQLSVIGPFLKDPQSLLQRLLKELESTDAERRLNATFALGWRGNAEAAIPLIERLYDPDEQVQQTAVNALCNLRDDRILDLLVDRFNQGSLDQKKVILFNLWRFHSKTKEVTEIYVRCLQHENPEIRFHALVCMGPITETREHLDVYRKCLKDSDARVRELALKRLAEAAGESSIKGLRPDIEVLLDDPNIKVKKAALAILRKNKKPLDFTP